MTTAEKLQAMEELWADLTTGSESFESPDWHLDELSATEKRVTAGEEEFIDWEAAKESLRNRAR